MWEENPALYDLAKRITLEAGLSYTDPRTGKTTRPKTKKKVKPKVKAKKIKKI